MPHPKMRVRIYAIVAMLGLAALALPLSADARVRVSVGIGVPVLPRARRACSPAGGGLPRARGCGAASRGRGPATGGVRWSPRDRREILRAPASPLAPSPPSPLAPLVRLPRAPPALPCRTGQEGLCFWECYLLTGCEHLSGQFIVQSFPAIASVSRPCSALPVCIWSYYPPLPPPMASVICV